MTARAGGAKLLAMVRSRLTWRLSLMFAFSGAAALLFETLWFRFAGLTFGNTTWASAVVLTSFMVGLAIGNLLAARLAAGRNALRLYALLEVGIGVTGVALTLTLPYTQDLFAPLFRALLASDLALNGARLVLAFTLLCIPTTLMGVTLPVVVGALSRSTENYGQALGLLYGWNTIGAVVGALAGELALIRLLGMRGTGVAAACLSATAALIALSISRDIRDQHSTSDLRMPRRATWPLLAVALSGFSLLALEVAWFRFVTLFIFASSLAFAVMLAVVLFGIGAGALVASVVARRAPDADEWAGAVAATAGVAVVLCYAGFHPTPLGVPGSFQAGDELRAVVADALRLMLPVSLLSGVLFTFIGRVVEREIGNATRATAVLTAFNTVGAATGAAVAGLLLIPRIGIESTFFMIAVVYGVVAILIMGRLRRAKIATAVAGALLVVSLLLFPFGAFRKTFVPMAVEVYLPSAEIVEVREGMIETAVYLRSDIAGRPYMYRLFTNGYSMSSTAFQSKRYMTMFTWLPLALNPDAKRALLISYGVGLTATSLAASPQLTSIDVVDISKEIMELSELVWPGRSNPLRDPRVRVHVEDGRFFLRTTDRRFDLITAEPPPPKMAGVVSLYTAEYFALLRDRLNEGGVASYWLPVYQLRADDSRAIIAAFCGAFDDCSLWSGGGDEWILAGSRNGRAVTAGEFSHQWKQPGPAGWLRAIGLERPEQLAATFLADADDLRRFVGAVPPLTDDRPMRLSTIMGGGPLPEYAAIHREAQQRFRDSSFVRKRLPAEIAQRAVGYFPMQRLIDQQFDLRRSELPPQTIESILTRTDLRILPRIVMGTDLWLEQIARDALSREEAAGPNFVYVAAVGELAERRYDAAARLFGTMADAGIAEAKPYAEMADRLRRSPTVPRQ